MTCQELPIGVSACRFRCVHFEQFLRTDDRILLNTKNTPRPLFTSHMIMICSSRENPPCWLIITSCLGDLLLRKVLKRLQWHRFLKISHLLLQELLDIKGYYRLEPGTKRIGRVS